MKKKLLLVALMLALIVCTLTISVSAHDTTRSVVLDSGASVDLYDAEGDALTWYMDGENLVSAKTKNVITVNGSGVASYSGINVMSVVVANFQGAEVEALNVKQIPVFYYGSNGGAYHSYNDVVEYIYLPDTLTATVTNQFRCTSKLKIVDVTRNSNWSTMGQYSFYYAKALKEFYYPPKVKTTPGGGNDGSNGTAATFAHCESLKNLYFYDNSETETFGAACFNSCFALESVELPSTLKSTPASLFAFCSSLKELRVPNSVESVGERLVQGCTSLEKLWFPATMASIGQSMTYQASALKYVYIPASVTEATGSHHFTTQHASYSKTVLFYPGTEDQAKAFVSLLQSKDNNEKFAEGSYELVAWNSSVADSAYVEQATTAKKNYIVYGYSACEAFYKGVHNELDTENGSACYLSDCSRCDVEKKDISTDATHVLVRSYEYANGYMQAGEIVSICQNKNCKHGTKDTAITSPLEALFNGLLYSTAENGTGICVKYNINRGAIENYKESGKAISFGVVAIMSDKIGDGDVLNADGTKKTTSNIVLVDLTNEGVSAVTLKIVADENTWITNNEKSIYLLGYATDGEALEYLGEASTAEADRDNITSVKSVLISEYFPTPQEGDNA